MFEIKYLLFHDYFCMYELQMRFQNWRAADEVFAELLVLINSIINVWADSVWSFCDLVQILLIYRFKIGLSVG